MTHHSVELSLLELESEIMCASTERLTLRIVHPSFRGNKSGFRPPDREQSIVAARRQVTRWLGLVQTAC